MFIALPERRMSALQSVLRRSAARSNGRPLAPSGRRHLIRQHFAQSPDSCHAGQAFTLTAPIPAISTTPHWSIRTMPYRPLPEPIDRSRIELVEDHELRFWTRELQCSAEHLLEAIESVGVDAVAVVNYLDMRRHGALTAMATRSQSPHGHPERHAALNAFSENTLP
jgi:Protein of unknown function (DUF3606)